MLQQHQMSHVPHMLVASRLVLPAPLAGLSMQLRHTNLSTPATLWRATNKGHCRLLYSWLLIAAAIPSGGHRHATTLAIMITVYSVFLSQSWLPYRKCSGNDNCCSMPQKQGQPSERPKWMSWPYIECHGPCMYPIVLRQCLVHPLG
jgi:hypothetical protein